MHCEARLVRFIRSWFRFYYVEDKVTRRYLATFDTKGYSGCHGELSEEILAKASVVLSCGVDYNKNCHIMKSVLQALLF